MFDNLEEGIEDVNENQIGVSDLVFDEDAEEVVVLETPDLSIEVDDAFKDALGEGIALDTEEVTTEVGKKAKRIKEELELGANLENESGFIFRDFEGEPIPPRNVDGELYINVLPMEKLKLAGDEDNQIRKGGGSVEVFDLQKAISSVGLLEPLHVIPMGDIVGTDDNGLPDYFAYVILSGRRRFDACLNLGFSHIQVIVDTTISPELVPVLQGVAHTAKAYSFSERAEYGEYVKRTQPFVDYDLLESFLGYRTGEFLKAQQIMQFRADFPDIFKSVEQNKSTIDQAFKKLEKEIDKVENGEDVDDLDQQEMEDALRAKNGDELAELQMERHNQEVGKREILDPVLRRTVEARDDGTCQSCGYGEDEEDLMGIFNVHHMVAVQYGGSDSKENLILLCQNCHKLSHDYESGRFNPSKDLYERRKDIQRIVVLGNILRDSRRTALATVKAKDPNTYRVLDKGNISIGKALIKSGINLDLEEQHYAGSPYNAFVNATENKEGELSELENFETEEFKFKKSLQDPEETKDLPTPIISPVTAADHELSAGGLAAKFNPSGKDDKWGNYVNKDKEDEVIVEDTTAEEPAPEELGYSDQGFEYSEKDGDAPVFSVENIATTIEDKANDFLAKSESLISEAELFAKTTDLPSSVDDEEDLFQ